MRIDRILDERRPVFSFEFFPPKTDDGQRNLEAALHDLKEDQPDYVSVTYGAGGTTRERTVEITKWIKEELGLEAMAHLSCVGESTSRVQGDPRRDRRGGHRERAGPARRPARAARRSGSRTPRASTTPPSWPR